MPQLFRQKLIEVVKAIAPLIVVMCALQLTVVRAPASLFLQFLIGSLMAVGGLVLFYTGIDMGILPMGRFIGSELPRRGSMLLIVITAFLLGFVTTAAEPDVLVLSRQVEQLSQGSISGNVIIYTMALGVGFFVAIAMARIVLGFSMVYLLIAAYSAVIILSFFAPAEFIPLSYDSGSVTTGALTAPVVISLALGFSSVLAGRSTISNGFGLLGFASIGPIIAVMIMGILLH